MERSILNISLKDKIRNGTIRERTKVKVIIETVRDLKSRWAGHVARMEDKRWGKITTEWYPRGSNRARGEVKRRWRDEVEKKVGNSWMRIALDRVAWRQLWRRSVAWRQQWRDRLTMMMCYKLWSLPVGSYTML